MSTHPWVQRTDSKSAPPEGQTLRLHAIYVVEAFYREDYNKLEEGLLALAKLAESESEHILDFGRDGFKTGLQLIDAARHSLPYGSAYVRLGSLVNKTKLSGDSVLLAPPVELPSTIRSIEFYLHQVLPSMIMLIINTRIDQSEDTHGILAAVYETEWSGPGPHYVPEVLKTEAFRDHVWEIRRSIETHVAKFFRGVFLGGSVDNIIGCPCCPAIEMYSLNSIPLSKCEPWLKEHHRFLSCMGVSWRPGRVFKSRNHLLFHSEIPERTGRNQVFSKRPEEAWRIISSRWHYTGKRMPQGYTSPEFALVHEISYEIPELLVLTALQRLISLDMKALASARDAVFADLDVSQVSGRPLQTTFSQLAHQRWELDEIRFRFERTKIELGDGRSVRGLDPMRFERIKPLKSDAGVRLRQLMIDSILSLISTVASEMKLLNGKLSTTLGLADRRLNLELQARMDRFTRVSAAAGIIGVIVAGFSLVVTLWFSRSSSAAWPTAIPTSVPMSPTIISQSTAEITETSTPTATLTSTSSPTPTETTAPTGTPTPTKTPANNHSNSDSSYSESTTAIPHIKNP